MRPVIGITCDYDWENSRVQLHSSYYEGVFRSGGQPFLIPCLEEFFSSDILDRLDGLLLTGGQDCDSYLFGEEPHPQVGNINPLRDSLEIELCREAAARDMPVLGICRGIQVINIAMGGDIYQDLPTQWEGKPLVCHNQRGPRWFGVHEVHLKGESLLRKVMGVDKIRTNSFHHQAVRRLAEGFKAVGHTVDGVIEAMESSSHSFLIGVQWHPERMWERDPRMLQLFCALTDVARCRMQG
jgi:putative glutamine amidotransferase